MSTQVRSEEMEEEVERSFRLENTASPTRYVLDIRPDFEGMAHHDSTVAISFSGPAGTERVELHCDRDYIEIKSIRHIAGGGKERKEVDLESVDYDAKTKILGVPITADGSGDFQLEFEVRGRISDGTNGFYKALVRVSGGAGENKGHEDFVFCTQFESIYARKAIPCLDEPRHKAAFSVSITAPSGLTVLGNQALESKTEMGEGRVRYTFADTPRMSTYLLAFVIARLDFVETKSKSEVAIRVYATPDKKEQTKFALERARQFLDAYEEFFAVKYPLGKLDMVAIPNFAAGAMENWGLVTYRETALLATEQSGIFEKMRVTEVVGHELGHMWFGNLVTMADWDDLWLNEGFATNIQQMFSYRLTKNPAFLREGLTESLGSIAYDANYGTHAIEVKIENNEQIPEIFDGVTYGKGSSLVRMLFLHIGERKLRDSLRHYVKKYSERNAVTQDLWDCITEVTELQSVEGVMSSFTSQAGVPLVSLRVDEEDPCLLVIKQERFHFDVDRRGKDSRELWKIPYNMVINGREVMVMVSERETMFRFYEPITSVLGNHELRAHCVTVYDEALTDRLLGSIRDISVDNKLIFIHNTFLAFKAGVVPVGVLLRAVAELRGEEDWNLVLELSGVLLALREYFYHDLEKAGVLETYEEQIRIYFGQLLFKTIGVNKLKDNVPREMTRLNLMSLMSTVSDPEVVGIMLEKYQKLESVSADEFFMVIRTAIKQGGSAEYDRLVGLYEDEKTNASQKTKILRALGFSEARDVLEKGLEYNWGNKVRSQDRYFLVAGLIMGNIKMRTLGKECLSERWEGIMKEYSDDSMAQTFLSFLSAFNDQKTLDLVEKMAGEDSRFRFTKTRVIESIKMKMRIRKDSLEEMVRSIEESVLINRHQSDYAEQ